MKDYKKKYEEALERAKMEMSKDGMKNDVIAIHLAETIFPELKESEDEKVRKELIKHLKDGAKGYEPAGGSSDYQRWLAWVEKQGERKTPQWMIDFLDNYRRKIGCSLDHDEARDVEGKILCIMQWLEWNPNVEQKPTEQQMYWTKEDEKLFEKVILHVKKYQQIANPANETGESDLTDWLKSLKQRIMKGK